MAVSMLARVRFMLGLVGGFAAFGALACDPVTSVPATLGRGVYCLTADIGVGGQAAFVLNNDATLDCRGHTIKDATLSTINAVVSSGDNVEIRNCVFEGFSTPVWFWETTHFRITGNSFRKTMNIGIFVKGNEGLVSHNNFSYPKRPDAGFPDDWYGSQSLAIQVLGTADIVGNTITAAASDGSGWTDRAGIWSSGSEGSVIAYNVVRGLVPGQGNWRLGVLAQGTGVAYRNIVSGTAVSPGPAGDAGMSCQFEDGPVAVQNIVVGYATPYRYCTNPGRVELKAGASRR